MLSMYIAQQRLGLSDEGIEDANYDIQSVRNFVSIDLMHESVPDATTLLKLRRLLKSTELTRRVFNKINGHLANKGLTMRQGTIVDATLIAVPASTKNRDNERYPEMHQSMKGNDWNLGMKEQVGVDMATGLFHTIVGTAGNVADVTQGARVAERWRNSSAGRRRVSRRGKARRERGQRHCFAHRLASWQAQGSRDESAGSGN
jgi:IS5 family transposase